MDTSGTDPMARGTSREGTEYYMPGVQYGIRILFGTLAALYFYWGPVPLLLFHELSLVSLFAGYFLFHLLAWEYSIKRRTRPRATRLANWVDLVFAGLLLVNDTLAAAPMLIFLFIAVLGNGLQHGLRAFSELLLGAIVTVAIAMPSRAILLGETPAFSLIFLMLFLTIGLYYVFLLVERIERTKDHAIRTSYVDALTGMPNRRAFADTARILLARHARKPFPLSVLFADIDKFKQVNDSLGHDEGDRVLKQFAVCVRRSLRASDVVARYGGDEFVFMLPDAGTADARLVASRIQTDFAAWASGEGLMTGVSFGVCEVFAGENDLAPILRRADSALYRVKKQQGGSGIGCAAPLDGSAAPPVAATQPSDGPGRSGPPEGSSAVDGPPGIPCKRHSILRRDDHGTHGWNQTSGVEPEDHRGGAGSAV